MNILPSECTVFVQVWVDVNGLQQDATTGCYAVSNRSNESGGEGTANLTTQVITGSNVCWAVLPIDPQYAGGFTITGVGVESGWAQPPGPVQGQPNVFTGRVEESSAGGTINSNIAFSYSGEDAQITVNMPVTIIPVTA
ncbi:MAG: hypothetical protein QOE79_941 [Sphingomonadales bacterium]|jgi:hypothetical protein|nr:hypothetical protein [Sphingomonadales bacterium]